MTLDLVAWAERFVSTPSVSSDGNSAMAACACELLAEAGIEARREATRVDGVVHETVIADLGPREAPHGVLLVTHLDTVPPGELSAWTATGGDPWKPVRDGDRLYGLGSADAKVDLVCKAAGLAQLEHSRLRRPVRLVGSFGEEVGMLGARWLVEQGLASGYRYALVGEPSELVAIHAHKGRSVYRARIPLDQVAVAGAAVQATSFGGRSAHSSSPELGENAIDAALSALADEDVVGLVALEGGDATNKVPDRCALSVARRCALSVARRSALPAARGGDPGGTSQARDAVPLVRFHAAWHGILSELRSRRDPSFDPDHSVGNLGRAELAGGVAVLEFDLRPIPGVEAADALAPLEELARIECVRANPPLGTPVDSPLVNAVVGAQQALGLGRRLGTKATCTEAGVLSQAGLDAVVIGPGLSVGNVHRPNEYTRISELGQARDLYGKVIRALCIEEASPCSS